MIENKLIVLNRAAPAFTENYCEPDAHDHCPTCSDEALPARVLEVKELDGMAIVELNDKPVEVDVSLIDDVLPGKVLLIHGGVAVGSIDEEVEL